MTKHGENGLTTLTRNVPFNRARDIVSDSHVGNDRPSRVSKTNVLSWDMQYWEMVTLISTGRSRNLIRDGDVILIAVSELAMAAALSLLKEEVAR